MIIKTEKYDSFINNVVYMCFFIHQFAFLFGVSDIAHNHEPYHMISNLVKIIPFVFMLFAAFYYFLRGKYSIKEIFIYIVIAIPLLISLYNYRVVMVISNLLYAIIFKNVDARKCLKIALYASIFGFIFNLFIGIFTPYNGNCIKIRYGVERIRYGLGFFYCNLASYFYQSIVITFLLIKKNIKLFEYIIIACLNVIIFIFTDTKAVLFYVFLAIIIHIVISKYSFSLFIKLYGVVCVLAYPVAIVFAIMMPLLYDSDNNLFLFLNRIVNGRFSLMHNAILACGVTVFGQKVSISGDNYYIDSAIVNVLVQNGIIVLIMCMIFMTMYSYMAVKVKDKGLMVALPILALSSIFDMGFMSMQLGPVIVLFYEVLNRFIKRDIKSA